MYQKLHGDDNGPKLFPPATSEALEKTMKMLLSLFLLPLLSPSTLFAQQSATRMATNPCAVTEQKEFDFWLGEWDLTWPGQHAGEVGHGTNSVQRTLDGCVVQEGFS